MKYFLTLAVLIFALAPLLSARAAMKSSWFTTRECRNPKPSPSITRKSRQVPENQIYGFALTTNEEMSRDEFRDSLQLPLAKKLEDGRPLEIWPDDFRPRTNGQPERVVSKVVASKIRYAVLCYGVPLKIAPDPDMHEPAARKNAAGIAPQRSRRGFRTRVAAVVENGIAAGRPAAQLALRRDQHRAGSIRPTASCSSRGSTGRRAEIANGLVDKAVAGRARRLVGTRLF